jgi:hypothetical protein
MQIWVDADACPRVIKEILFRAAQRRQVLLTLVANQPLRHPNCEYITSIVVGAGFDVADDKIVELSTAGDLVITADIPLAAAVVQNGAAAINPRGQLYTDENIQEILSMRDMMDELRGAGVELSGPAPFSSSDKQSFANQLDKFLVVRTTS